MRSTPRQPRLGQHLRQLRERAGLSRAQLSQASGVDPSTLARLEGGHDVRLSSYLDLIDFFIQRDPETWMLAQRFVVLGRQDQAAIVRRLTEPNDGERDA